MNMSMFDIKIDAQGLEKAQKALANMPGAFQRAQGRAVRAAMRRLRVRVKEITGQKYYAKPSEITKSMSIHVTSSGGMLKSSGRRKNIRDYYLSPKKPAKKRQKGLMGAVKKDGIKSLPGAFLIGHGGKYWPYKRVGKGRWGSFEGLEGYPAPAMPQIIGNEESLSEYSGETARVFDERLRHEVMYELGAFAK